jgi:hypothetical protein
MESLVLMNEGCSHEPHLWPEQLPAIANGPAPPLPTAVHRTGRHDSSNAHRPAGTPVPSCVARPRADIQCFGRFSACSVSRPVVAAAHVGAFDYG